MASGLDPFTLTNGSTGGGRRLANTPRYGYTFGTRYRDASGFFANAELVARASQLDSNNQNEARRAFRVVNASLGYTWQRWTFTVWGRVVVGLDLVRALDVGQPPANPVKITRVRAAADLPAGERPTVEIADTASPAFQASVQAARKAAEKATRK